VKSRSLLAIALTSFLCGQDALATPKHTVQRGGKLVIVTHFARDVRIQKGSMTWQTYDPLTPQQKGMERPLVVMPTLWQAMARSHCPAKSH